MNALKGQMPAMQTAIQAIQESHEKISQDIQVVQTKVQAMQTTHTQDIQDVKASISTIIRACGSSRISEVEKLVVKGLLDICKYPGPGNRPQILPAARVAYLRDLTPNELDEENGEGYAEIIHKFLLKRRELGQKFDFPEEELFGQTSPEARTLSDQGPIPGEHQPTFREAIERISQRFQSLPTLHNESARTTNAYEVHFLYHSGAFTEEVRRFLEDFWSFLFSDELPLMKKDLVSCSPR